MFGCATVALVFVLVAFVVVWGASMLVKRFNRQDQKEMK